MIVRTRALSLVGAGSVLVLAAGLLAATTDASGRGPVTDAVGAAPVTLRMTSVDVQPTAVSLAWRGTSDEYRVSIGDNLSAPAATVTTTDAAAVLAAPAAADPSGRVNYRVEAVDDGQTEVAVEGTVTLLPGVPAKPKVDSTGADGAVLQWQPAPYATTYDVAFSRTKDALPQTVRRLTESGTSITAGKLKPATTYWVRVRAVGAGGVSEFGPARKITTMPASSTFTVGAWNICSEACSGYGGRVGGQAAQVQASNVDIMTLQEAGGVRVGAITKARFSGGARGFVVAEGGGNSRYIFYRDALFDQVSGGRWAIGHGRWAAWARLTDLATQRDFIVVSVHLLTGHGAKSQRASETRSLLSNLRSINTDGLPVILAGDFNTGRHRSGDTVGPLVRAADYTDSVEIADKTENAQVNTGSRKGNRAIMSADYVDHVYVSPQWKVPFWHQWVTLNGTTYVGKWLSDHNMISATVTLEREDTEQSQTPTPVTRIPLDQATPQSTPTPLDATTSPEQPWPMPTDSTPSSSAESPTATAIP